MMKLHFMGFALMIALVVPVVGVAQEGVVPVVAAVPALDFSRLPEPMAFAKSNYQRALELNAMRVSDKRNEEIKSFVDALVDYDDFALRSLGDQWSTLGVAKQAEFRTLFRELLEISYLKKLSDKSFKDDYPIDWDRVVKTRDSAVVSCFTQQKDVETELEIVFHAAGERWEIYDILVDGASLAKTYQKKYAKKMDEKGVDGIMQEMRDEIARLKAQ